MRASILRCDLCGHDSTPDNPVTIHVCGIDANGTVTRPVERREFESFFLLSPELDTKHCDLCQDCARALIALLNDVHAKREAAKADERARAVDSASVVRDLRINEFLKRHGRPGVMTVIVEPVNDEPATGNSSES